MSWQSLKSLMNKSLEKAGINEQVTAQRILDSAAKLLKQRWGDDMAETISFTSFSRGNLHAVSNSSGALQNFKLERIDFMNALNYQMGKRVVFRIEIKLKGF